MKLFVCVLLAFSLQIVHGESPPIELPPDRICPTGQKLCNHHPGTCYSPSTQQCLTYFDGSGGILCPHGNTFCGGNCLVPNMGKECATKHGFPEGSAFEKICNAGQKLCGISKCYTPTWLDCVDGTYICDKGQSVCGTKCYTPSADIQCVKNEAGWSYVCKTGDKACGSQCYSPQKKKCIQESLVDI